MKEVELLGMEIRTEQDEKVGLLVTKVTFNTQEYGEVSARVKEYEKKKVEAFGVDVVDEKIVNSLPLQVFVNKYPNLVSIQVKLRSSGKIRVLLPVNKFEKVEDGVSKTISFVKYALLDKVKIVEGQTGLLSGQPFNAVGEVVTEKVLD